jgi:hypothetical protein
MPGVRPQASTAPLPVRADPEDELTDTPADLTDNQSLRAQHLQPSYSASTLLALSSLP